MGRGNGFEVDTIEVYRPPSISEGRVLLGSLIAHKQEHFTEPMETGAGINTMDSVMFYVYGVISFDVRAGDIVVTSDGKEFVVKDIIRHETARRKYAQIVTSGEE